MSRPTEELHELAQRAEADFREMVRACEERALAELELRRRQLAAECSKLLQPS